MKIDIECEENFGFKLYIKFLNLVNCTFDDCGKLADITFLEQIMSKDDILFILKNRLLNLKLRTEIIKFYRMMHIDVSIIDEMA